MLQNAFPRHQKTTPRTMGGVMLVNHDMKKWRRNDKTQKGDLVTAPHEYAELREMKSHSWGAPHEGAPHDEEEERPSAKR